MKGGEWRVEGAVWIVKGVGCRAKGGGRRVEGGEVWWPRLCMPNPCRHSYGKEVFVCGLFPQGVGVFSWLALRCKTPHALSGGCGQFVSVLRMGF